jgi:hypothetical protein
LISVAEKPAICDFLRDYSDRLRRKMRQERRRQLV